MGIGSANINQLYNTLFNIEKPKTKPESREKVVLIGYGWAGKAFADRLNTKQYNLTVISDAPGMLNTTRMKKSLLIDDQNLFRFGQQLMKTERVQRVDLDKRQVYTSTSTHPYEYDYLVVATGSEVNDFNVPGVREHCHFFKSHTDLEKLRSDLHQDKEIVIVGAGLVGLELAFELNNQGYKKITLVEAQTGLLPSFSPATQEKIHSELQKCDISVKFNTPVISVQQKQLKTSNDSIIPFDIAIWNCGVKPVAVPGLELAGGTGRVDNRLRINASSSVFAIGDITRKGPPTAQNAKQQGIHLANFFNNNKAYAYDEKIKVLHTKDSIIIDFENNAFQVPKYFDQIYNLFI
jgi:NADH dehydrogenase FAD-containing subunit